LFDLFSVTMTYEITKWPLSRLVELTTSEAINLRPPYQRNDIWTTPAKRRLIQTIHDGFPLPAFFLHETVPNEKYDMVDGQQRTRAIMGYLDRSFKDESGKLYDNSTDASMLNYEIPVIIIRNVEDDGGASIRDFYYRVNKFGTKLSRPEIQKAQYANTPLQALVEEIADTEQWEALELFTDAAQNRMSDLDFIAELLTLLRYGITDKKIQVDRFYEDATFTEESADSLKADFNTVIDRIRALNEAIPISGTRYKQRNDFYTLFHWIHSNPDISLDHLHLMYRILVRVGVDISPSNEECFPLQDYAINCVSQSNSKSAREGRHAFFQDLLQNTSEAPMGVDSDHDENQTLADVMRYYQQTNDRLIRLGAYRVLDPDQLPQAKA
jgi:hypothetical protein